jgi:hypothetical protein
MSIEALSFVLKQDMSRSSEKFVLVCIANYADERGFAYPSVATLVRDTGQDRKTVIQNLKRLTEAGMLNDTGQRVGKTGSIPVYELVGIPSNSTVHYVYRLSNIATGEFYVGMRSFNGDPELDVYRGGGRWVLDMLSRGVLLHREIIDVFDNDVEARACEMAMFRQVWTDPLCRNEAPPHGSSRELKGARSAVFGTAEKTSTENGTGQKTSPVFPGSSTVFPTSSPVFPPKQSQKRDTEPSCKPSDKPSEEPNAETSPQTTPKKPRKQKQPPAPLSVELPPWLPESAWNDWVEHRIAVKAPMTQRAAELIIAKLSRMRDAGHNPVASINQAVESGKWTTLWPVREDHAARQGGQSQTGYTPKFDPMNSGAFDDLDPTGGSAARTPRGNYGVVIDVDARSVDSQA